MVLKSAPLRSVAFSVDHTELEAQKVDSDFFRI